MDVQLGDSQSDLNIPLEARADAAFVGLSANSSPRTAPAESPHNEPKVNDGAQLDSHSQSSNHRFRASITMAEFVEHRFIPEFVSVKRRAGRIHFRAILKHVLPPELVARAFGKSPYDSSDKLTTVTGWPYLDRLRLSEITAVTIHRVMSKALEHGYSAQTAIHIRNVIRAVFEHAIRTGDHADQNPAAQVDLPKMTRIRTHTLNLGDLSKLMNAMSYPEKDMALLALLTGMSVAEICGLQWKDLNLSKTSRVIGNDVIPPRTIAVRNQSYRGKVSPVIDSRKRFVRIPLALERSFGELRARARFIGPHDFVLVSQNGTPIHPENIAARRLKLIGNSFGMPWLTWSVFYRTRRCLRSEFGIRLQDEFEKAIQSE